MIRIVVAWHEESLTWLKNLSNFDLWIYRKGKKPFPDDIPATRITLPNVGREAHTYLKHIVDNYSLLAPVTLFMQGKTAGHVTDPIKRIRAVSKNEELYEELPHFALKFKLGQLDQKEVPMACVWRELFRSELDPDYEFSCKCCAIFACGRKRILARDLEFYQRALEISRRSPESISHTRTPESLVFERLWYLIFDPEKEAQAAAWIQGEQP